MVTVAVGALALAVVPVVLEALPVVTALVTAAVFCASATVLAVTVVFVAVETAAAICCGVTAETPDETAAAIFTAEPGAEV